MGPYGILAMIDRLVQLLAPSHRPRILVVGDVMLDRYVWGDVDRISYEAPIPVLHMERREERLGGAGSVVAILAAMDVEVSLTSVVGDDLEGRAVHELLRQWNVATESIIVVSERLTTVKDRLLGRKQSRHPQQMIRVDREDTHDLPDDLSEQLIQQVHRVLDRVDVVLVSDYDKGVCAGDLIPAIASASRKRGIPVIADPARDVDFRRYAGCTAVTPNRTEAGIALECIITEPEEAVDAARGMLKFGLDAAIVTLDRDGIAWADAQGRAELVPVEQRQVYDVTGAGDAVLSALGYGLAVGGDWPAAIKLANLAGGLEVQRLGVVPISRPELLAEVTRNARAGNHRVVTVEQLELQLRQRRQGGQRIVMTNGCFDLLHPGHVASLEFARQQGDCLVVGLNSDQSVRALKGPGRPVIDEQGRAAMLTAMTCVDYVVIFNELSVEPLVNRVLPDVLVKAAEYGPEEVVGYQSVIQNGGRVQLAPMQEAYSTSQLIERIRRTDE